MVLGFPPLPRGLCAAGDERGSAFLPWPLTVNFPARGFSRGRGRRAGAAGWPGHFRLSPRPGGTGGLGGGAGAGPGGLPVLAAALVLVLAGVGAG
jgi:hypothetical protein